MLIEFIQLFLAAILGAFIGLERSFAGKTAGMRTYALVAMSSTLFVIVSNDAIQAHQEVFSGDPLRMAAAIVTGIGFLGAGLIIFQDKKLNGLTTAAGLWVASGVGIAVGFGVYWTALFAAVLTLLIFRVFWHVERSLTDKHNKWYKRKEKKEDL